MTANTPPANRLGIDFGNVIQGDSNLGPEDTSFIGATVEQALNSPPLPGAVESIRLLVQRFDKRVWIVSRAGATMQRKTLAWLNHNDWWTKTGMEPWSVAFVLHRAQKAEVAKALRLTHFIDDRDDVLSYLDGIVAHRYWFGQTESIGGLITMPDWTHVHLIQ